MMISAHTQAVLLLTAHFGKDKSGPHRPLTPKDYGRFAEWLKSQSLTPERLLTGDPAKILGRWHDKAISGERVNALLERGSALALSVEKWLRAGLWVMTRSDADYPQRLKQRLRSDSPAVLFGCGNRGLLNAGGLAVVGSRKVKQADLSYSARIGEIAATAGVSIVSGGAKGIDETAMLGTLKHEGTAVGVLADDLLRACASAKYRRFLMDNSLVLVSPFNPEARFNVGHAMQRNKYIYCLADAALAVHSGKKGGTWSGAHEDLKESWVPLWVKRTNDPEAGNGELIAAGALEASDAIAGVDIAAFFRVTGKQPKTDQDLFSKTKVKLEEHSPSKESVADPGAMGDVKTTIELKNFADKSSNTMVADSAYEASTPQFMGMSQTTFYDLFVFKVQTLCANEPRTPDELIDALGLNKAQLNTWLKQAVENGTLKKLTKPVRYQMYSNKQGTLMLE